MTRKTISIVSPCFNEADNVARCHATVRALFDGPLADYDLEHIFADNDSTDGTPDILREIAASDPSVKVILNARNFGPFRSMFNALRSATGDAVVVFLAGDLQDPPEKIVDFVRTWETGVEVVAGARVNRQESLALRICRGIFYRIVNGLSDIDIPVNVGEFQLIDRKVWAAVVEHDDHYPYVRGIIASVGFNRVIVPYTWEARKSGISKNNLPRLVDQALNGIFSFTNAPMRVCTFAGFGLAALCMLYALGSVVAYLFDPSMAPRGTMTMIVSLFFLSGIQLIFIGILGEYVTSIHSQVRRGPMVVERERINFETQTISKNLALPKNSNNPVHKLQKKVAKL
jgi:glycosyltransferase involved in cell wall biosynthesis